MPNQRSHAPRRGLSRFIRSLRGLAEGLGGKVFVSGLRRGLVYRIPLRFPALVPLPFRISVIRPQDFIVLDVEFDNLRLETGNEPRLVRIQDEKPAYLIVHFPAQNIAEQAFFQQENAFTYDNPDPNRPDPPDEDPTPPPVQARLAGPSRLVFRMPDDVGSLPYTMQGLLAACKEWDLNLAPAALPAFPPPTLKIADIDKVYRALGAAVVDGLTRVGSELTAQAAAAVEAALVEHLSGTVKEVLLEAMSEAGVEDLFDVEAIVDESIQGVLPSLATLATEAVARMDAASLVDLFHAGVGAVTAEAADRVELVEKEAGIKIGVANLLRVFSAPSPPGHLATAIELPYLLFISPNKHAAWNHSIAAVSHAGRTELWHTRMGIRRPDRSITEEPHAQRTLRAIWTPDYEQPQAVSHTDSPFRMSLTARDREMLVKVTAGYDISGWTPQPTYVHRLMLSALGGWLDTEGSWTKNRQGLDHPDVGVELEAWKHQATMGRDHYVRVVYAGFLFPFGHAASLVKVTERKFESDQVGRIAYLRQRYFIVVREPVRDFPGPRQQYAGRQFPFTQIGIKTTVTPNLGQPGLSDGLAATRDNIGASDQALFWPFVGGKPFEFELVARDAGGRQTDFTAPLIFVSKENGLPYIRAKVTQIINAYGADTNEAKNRRTRSFSGQSVRYAPSAKAGDTDLETESITFGGQLPGPGLPTGEPAFYPSLEGASVRVAALQRLLGESTSIPVRYPGTGGHSYLKAEFGSANPGEVFLEVDNTARLEVKFGAGNHGDKAGGLVTPDLSVCGLSRSIGLVGGSDIKKAAQATFDPKDFFKDATILGGLSLADIVSMVSGFDQAQNATAVPRLTHTRNGDTALTIYRWQTTHLVQDPLNLFLPHVNGTSTLSVESKIEVTGTKPPVSETKASLTNFKMNLFGFIILWFDKLEFKAVDGNKPDIDFVMHPTDSVTFGGPLEFVNKLREFIPSGGFMDPPDIDVSPTGLTASYSLGLPPIGVGMFSLENVKLGASFKLPFDGSAAIVRFNFAERHDTFILTVSALGGGGFFALATSTDGVRELEAALEFGGSLSLNVGVASGGVYVKAGIYFRWVSDPSLGEMAELTGYVEVGGSLSVLGLISVSLVFYMALTYTDNGKVWGQATLIVEIEVLFFSTSVSVTVERQFKGSAGDPTFADLFKQSDWETYCDAFALEAAA